MRSRWILAAAVLLAALFAAHAKSLPMAMSGEVAYSYAFDRCDAHYVTRAAPAPRGTRPSAEGCDTLYSQRMGWDGWRRAVEAWDTRSSLARFLFVDLWRVAVDARALNVLDLLLLVWPARLAFGAAAGLAVLHLGLVALASLSGVLFARTLGASPLGGLAAGLVVGGSGLVLESVTRGQYPQAVVAGALCFFAGLQRIVRDERGGVALAGAGAGVAALLYWQNGLLLGVGAALFLLGARLAGPFAAGTTRRLAAGAALSLAVAAVPAIPVLGTVAEGTEKKVQVEPWGTPFPVHSDNPDDHVDLIDEVPYFTLFSPTAGWIPVLPLLPLAVLGLARRDRAGWALLVAFGLVMATGPLPAAPGSFGGQVVAGYGAMERTVNPVYTAVYRWVPTASRQHHPMRWATLLVVGAAAGVALGVDRARRRWPDHALIAVGAGLVWTAWVGPWPLRQASFPRDTLAALDDCTALVLPRVPAGDRDLDDVHRLEALTWKPRAPARSRGSTGVGGPSAGMRAWSESVEDALAARLAGGAPPADDPLAGTCVLYEASWFGSDAALFREQLLAAFGQPDRVLAPTGLLMADGTTRSIAIFRPGGARAH